MTYTALTFAPVQSFIRASRKLRDLYGSSLLLSHLARALAEDAAAKGLKVISPASVDSSRGVPNVLVIAGDYRKGHARDALKSSWQQVLQSCRSWLEGQLENTNLAPDDWERSWGSSWKACGLHAWELFHGQGDSISQARQALAVNKLQRDWSVPNWTGESSSLSSAEAVVRPTMGLVIDPRDLHPGQVQEETRAFMAALRENQNLGEAFAGENEELSLTELVKRLVTYPAVAGRAFADPQGDAPDLKDLLPQRFQKLSGAASGSASGSAEQQPESTIWFMADGDSIGQYLEGLTSSYGADSEAEAKALQSFSASMRQWAAGLYDQVPEQLPNKAIVIYAGGDDVFGALHESEPGLKDLQADDLWRWLELFPEIWQQCGQENLTVSMGLVWADSAVPQREALQHVRDAEARAKQRGRDRFALRLLYASGNYLEWTCPWTWLQPIRQAYRDREGRSGDGSQPGRRRPQWRHLADDLLWLRSRRAIGHSASDFKGKDPALKQAADHSAREVAEALLTTYFPGWLDWQQPDRPELPEKDRRLDEWLLDLGRVMAGLEKRQPRSMAQQQEVTA